jgi:hypothetical protein
MQREVIPLVVISNTQKEHSLKWTNQDGTRYEIHCDQLESMELKDLVPHCLLIRNKVMKAVQTNAHQGPSLYEVFPRTLSMTLQGIWDTVIADAGNHGQTLANFNHRMNEFISLHATAED